MFKRMRRLWRIIKYAITKRKSFTLYLLRAEAEEYLKVFDKLDVKSTEDIQDLIFHIDSYLDLPNMLRKTMYEEYLKKGEKFEEYFHDLEKMRAVERDYIFEIMKRLPIGFEF